MEKIVFGITNLSIGGAERTLVDLCNEICNKYDITIFTIYGHGELEKDINPKIKVINLYINSFEEINSINKKLISFKLFFMQKFIYKKYIKNKFNTEIAFLEGPITRLFSSKNKKAKKIAWVHTDISLIFGNGLKSRLKKFINRKIYNSYDNVIFVSHHSLNKFNETYNVGTNKFVINNYIDSNKILEMSDEKVDFEFDKNTINFLSVCRLVKPKALDRLIKVHTQLINDGYYHKIYIIGDGPEKHNLENLIKKYNVENTFILLGQKKNPYPYIKACNYFCLLSYYEGYGIVVEEAKTFSKHIVITDTASREAVENYKGKTILPNNEPDMYEGLKDLIINNKSFIADQEYKYNNNIIIKKIIEILGD